MCLISDPGISQRTSSCLWYSEIGDQDAALIYNWRLRCWDLGSSLMGSKSTDSESTSVHCFTLSSPLQAEDIIGSCLEAPQRPGPLL